MTRQDTLYRSAALVTRARRALQMARLVAEAAALGGSTSVLAFEGTMWENRGVDYAMPVRAENPLRVARRVVPGEHDPVAVKLFNIMDQDVSVRTMIESPDAGVAATLRHSVAVPTSLAETSWDALPELDESDVIVIPPLSTREVWLDIVVGDATAGEHKLTARFLALNGAGVLDSGSNPHDVPAPETTAEITLKVLPFAMAPPGVFRLCCWASLDGPVIADLLAHGNNVFCAPMAQPVYDEQGRLTGIDTVKLDEVITPMKGHDVVVLLTSYPALKGEVGSPAYNADLKAFLEQLTQHLAQMGFDNQHFALYPADEPGGNGWNAVNGLVAFGKCVRAVSPATRIYVDGGGEMPMFEAMAPCIDIWCPGTYMLPEQSPVMDLIRNSGKERWCYNCGYAYARPIGPNIKNINLIAEFRIAPLFCLRHGCQGLGYWSYNIGPDMWTRATFEYPLVYTGRKGPVTSRRWEAVREGIEDHRILKALAEKGAGNEAVRARIDALIKQRLPEWLDESFDEMNLGLDRETLDETNNDAVLTAFRNEMLDCVEALCESGP